TLPSAFETIFCASTTMSSSSSSTARTRSPAMSSPWATSGIPSSGRIRSSVAKAGESQASDDLVLPVHVDDHRGHSLERARVRERAGVDRAPADEVLTELEHELLRIAVVAADQDVLVEQPRLRKLRRRQRLEAGYNRPGHELGNVLGDRALAARRKDSTPLEAKVAGDAEDGRRTEYRCELACGVDRRRRLHCEHGEVDVAHRLRVRRA